MGFWPRLNNEAPASPQRSKNLSRFPNQVKASEIWYLLPKTFIASFVYLPGIYTWLVSSESVGPSMVESWLGVFSTRGNIILIMGFKPPN